jgi:hypothetical protein
VGLLIFMALSVPAGAFGAFAFSQKKNAEHASADLKEANVGLERANKELADAHSKSG